MKPGPPEVRSPGTAPARQLEHQGRFCARRLGRLGSGKDQGAVTAEFAVALLAVILLLALLLAGSAAGITQLRLEEAARAGARALARGEGNAVVEGIVRRLAGDSASTVVAKEGEWLSVTVSGRVGGPLGSVIPWPLTAKASARSETPSAPAAALHRSLPPNGVRAADLATWGGSDNRLPIATGIMPAGDAAGAPGRAA
ncbi:TadE family type IV pilus minor pilin [Arthrobacter sp. ISL-30]|uniref:TadE family type IV pilus minor pilin n=1 Tax=Arthrobacter sp. ISL-30 TaxID=2819109 RepID=UPI0027DF874F|nr:TadE family type IV pilus minor pilin [Arthrobacter sp. ISL-30]